MSSKLNLFTQHGYDEESGINHTVEYGFKQNADFVMVENFNNDTQHSEQPHDIPAVGWEVEITIKKEDLTINQIEDHKNKLDEGMKVDMTETIAGFFNEARKEDYIDTYQHVDLFRQNQQDKHFEYISKEFEDYLQMWGINYNKKLTHNLLHKQYKKPWDYD